MSAPNGHEKQETAVTVSARALRHIAHVYHTTPAELKERRKHELYACALGYAAARLGELASGNDSLESALLQAAGKLLDLMRSEAES